MRPYAIRRGDARDLSWPSKRCRMSDDRKVAEDTDQPHAIRAEAAYREAEQLRRMGMNDTSPAWYGKATYHAVMAFREMGA